MKHLLMGVYQVCANKSPWVKLALQRWGLGAYIQVSDLRAIMALLLFFSSTILRIKRAIVLTLWSSFCVQVGISKTTEWNGCKLHILVLFDNFT
jgi:hypothetical protein